MRLKKGDLHHILGSIRKRRTESRGAAEQFGIRPLTNAEKQQAWAAVAAARQLRTELRDRYGGETFSESADILAEMRDERTRQLD